MSPRDELAYAAISLLNAVLAELAVELAQHQLPLPASVLPFVPLVVVVLTQLTRLLPSVVQGPAPTGPTPAPVPTPAGTTGRHQRRRRDGALSVVPRAARRPGVTAG